MTIVAPTTSPSTRTHRLSAPAGALTLLVQIIALFSLVTNGYRLWIESRFTLARHLIPPDVLPGLWAWPEGSTPTLPDLSWLALPMTLFLYLWTASVFAHFALRRAGAKSARWCLLPTLLLIALLVMNSIYYWRLFALGRLDSFHIPITAYAALLLSAWVFMMRGDSTSRPPKRRASRWSRLLFFGFALISLAAAGWFFGFAFRENPPEAENHQARIAVVFGNFVRPDGMPGQVMGDRVLRAIDLYKRGMVQKILLSGAMSGQDGTGRDETAAMHRLCDLAHIPEQDVYLDPVGINTRATVEGTRQLLKTLPPMEVVGVSGASHLRRVRISFAQAGINVSTMASMPTVWQPEGLFEPFKELYATVVYMSDPNYRPAIGVSMNIKQPRLVVSKSKRTLELYDEQRLVKTYACITGLNPGDKEVEGDKKTPLGTFHIVFKNPQSKFHLSLGLDYPNAEDVARGVQAGLLTQAQAADVLDALKSDLRVEANQNRLWKSPLGGEIFIHGHGEGRDGTAGCVALSNPEIEELYAICELGTQVEIRP